MTRPRAGAAVCGHGWHVARHVPVGAQPLLPPFPRAYHPARVQGLGFPSRIASEPAAPRPGRSDTRWDQGPQLRTNGCVRSPPPVSSAAPRPSSCPADGSPPA